MAGPKPASIDAMSLARSFAGTENVEIVEEKSIDVAYLGDSDEIDGRERIEHALQNPKSLKIEKCFIIYNNLKK